MEWNKVRFYRTLQGLTLKDLSELTGIVFQLLSRMERGHVRLTSDDMEKISKALGISEEDLFGNIGSKPKMTRLKYERLKRCYTLKGLGSKIGILDGNLYHLENGFTSGRADGEIGGKLVGFFGIPVEELLKEVKVKSSGRCDTTIIKRNCIKTVRKKKGLSLKELHELSGINASNLRMIESHQLYCWTGWRERLSKVLGVPVEVLFEDGMGSEDTPKKFTRLRYERLKEGYSLRDLEKITKINKNIIHNLETGRLVVGHLNWVNKLSGVFRVPAEEILQEVIIESVGE